MMISPMVSQWSHLFGALISLPCLLLVILIYSIGFSFIRMPRKTKHSLINILFLITCTITLFTISLTFPFTSSSSTPSSNTHQQQLVHCRIISALVHFSTLSCLLWIFLSAISMYRSLSHSAHEFSSSVNSSSSSSSNNNNTKSSTDDNEDDDLRLPDLPLRTRSIHHHSVSTFKKRTSHSTILGYYLFGYGLSSIICISCLTINFGSTYSSLLSSLTSSSASSAPLLFSSCYVPMTPGGYAVLYGPIALLFCLNLIVYLIVACILSCLGTNIVSPGATLHDSTISLKNGLNGLSKDASIKVDLEWTYRRQLFAQIGLFILFTNLIVSMIFLVAWRPFSFVNQLSTSTSSLFLPPLSTAAASTASINGSIVTPSTPATSTTLSTSNSSESISLIFSNSTSQLIPLVASSSSSSLTTTLQLSSSSSPPETASYLLSGNLNAFQLDQLFYGLVYSLSSFLLAFYMIILYVARRRDVRTLLTFWLKGNRNNHHNHHHQYHSRNRRNWFCCLTGSVPEIPLMPKVDVIRNSSSHSANSDHHHLAQALLQSVRETSSSNKLNIDECEISNNTSSNSKELAHGLVYEEIKIHDNTSREAIPYKVINNISSDLRNNLPSLIESPLINNATPTPYHLDYHQSNHEVFINPKLNAIAKKFFEKNRRRQEQQQQQLKDKLIKNDLDAKNVHSIISSSASSFKMDHPEVGVTASIFSNRPRLSFDNGYHSNGLPRDHHRNTGSASCVGVPIAGRTNGTNEINNLISRLQSAGKLSSSASSASTAIGSTVGPTSYSKAKSDIICWNPSSSFLAKWQGPRTNPPPLPPLPTRKEMMSISQSNSSQSFSSTVRQTKRLNLNGPTGKESPSTFQDNNSTSNTGDDNNLISGLRVKLSNRKLPAIISPPSPSNLHRALVKSSSSIPGALEDRDQQQSEIMSVCCGSEVMSTVSVPWTCYSKRTVPILRPINNPGETHYPINSSSSSSTHHRHHYHSHSHHHHRSHHKRSSRSHRNNHCNRCWDVYFCDICDLCSKSPPTRRIEINKDHSSGHLPNHRSLNSHHHHHLPPTPNSSALIKKDSSLIDVNEAHSKTGPLSVNNHSPPHCHPRKASSTVSSNGGERRRRRKKRPSQCKNRSSQGPITGYSNHGPCKHLSRSTSVNEYRSCHYCYTKHYSSSDTQ
ncbi:putative uncharacterized protein DDB_G0277255 [Tetranychus urticae]|uniref:Uncharacterized protein n=1 Tax=Tetranychus urticae TaxID=32264 RepID=T1KWQ5_TETUR|nr:putative uncharacterized protein DDB_G0277255 [Tetranychus urticae]